MIDNNDLENLRNLRKLLEENVISEFEYNTRKKDILGLSNFENVEQGTNKLGELSRKKFWIRISVGVVVLFIISGIGMYMGYNYIHSHDKNELTKQDSQKVNKKKKESSKSSKSSKSSSSYKKNKFDTLGQKEQLAVLIYKVSNTDSPDEKVVYMGEPTKIVIEDLVGAGGGALNHSAMFVDNGSSFTTYEILSNAQSVAEQSKDNSYWVHTGTYGKEDLYNIYQQNRNDIDNIMGSINLAQSSKVFPYLPTNQFSVPDQNSNTNAEQNDDDYYERKSREKNADFTLEDGTHVHNDDQGNSYDDQGQVIGKGSPVKLQ